MRLRPVPAAAAALLALVLAAPAGQAQTPAAAAPPPAPQAIKAVKPGLFMVTGGGGNTTVRVTSAGLIVVDGKNPGQTFYDDLMAQIRTVSPQPVKYLVVTHHHADHSGNTGRFLAAGAKVVAQRNLPAELDKFTPPANNPTLTAPARPDVTYAQTYTIGLGGKTVRLMHFAAAHTDADTIVYFPDLKAVSTGDELNAANPNFDYAGGASIAGWITSLDDTLKLDWDQAIPGHGAEPFTRAQVVAFRGKLATLLDRARAQVKASTPKDKLVASLKLDDLWPFPAGFWNAMRTDGLYAEAGGK
ncbi:MBL fold metallo-hydrolase [Phenylobacterium sp.]|uniref:MBL fold metallo-hydrolase n=1 Tax=Phenylobacterium sp. TaxID=1871053 RepID=UPI0025D80011|nr:MBL fold metallo-hydrolase [Phenylobacterium sp.]